jgi:hypothetical protein
VKKVKAIPETLATVHQETSAQLTMAITLSGCVPPYQRAAQLQQLHDALLSLVEDYAGISLASEVYKVLKR